MAEETKTTLTRGRKPKPKVEETVIEQNDMAQMMAKMQEQILALQKQLAESTEKVEKTDKEKSDLQQLVEALKSNENTETKNLPKKVKVISLVPNIYNLTTQENGKGKAFTFKEFGQMITMKTSELEEILSIQAYRNQAEQGYFYILDKDIVEDQDLTEAYEHISNKEAIEHVMNLDSDECVDIFCGLNKDMQESLAAQIAENMANGARLDRNRIADISMRTDIDIEKIAEQFSKIHK